MQKVHTSKTKSFFVLFAIIFLFSCASSKKEKINKQAALYFGAGTQSLMNQKYTDALNSLLKANELNPNEPEILNNLAMAYYFKGQTDLAITTLNRTLELDHKNSDARTNLASIVYRQGDVSKAVELYNVVLKDLTYEKQARTYFNLATIELNHYKNTKKAVNYLNLAVKEDENFCPAYTVLGKLYYDRGHLQTALNNFRSAAMGVCYNDPAPHYLTALTLLKLNRFDEAKIKLSEINNRFTQTVYGIKSRSLMLELQEKSSASVSSDYESPINLNSIGL
jgi:type IV pilus assembly protein PilF